MIRWMLFKTRAGDRLLALLERWARVGVVPIEDLEGQERWSIAEGARMREAEA